MAATLPTWRSGSKTTMNARFRTAAASAASFKHPPAQQPARRGPLIERFTKYYKIRVGFEPVCQFFDGFLSPDVHAVESGRLLQDQRLLDHAADECQLASWADHLDILGFEILLLKLLFLLHGREERRIGDHQVCSDVRSDGLPSGADRQQYFLSARLYSGSNLIGF
jgi:hypothetical protein